MTLDGKRIYIVEDKFENRTLFRRVLEFSGATVHIDKHGLSSIPAMMDFEPDIILLDIMLSHGMSGYDIYGEIKTMPVLREIPVVAVSATNANEGILKAKTYGFDGFIGKPIDIDTFPEQVARVLNGKKVWAG